LLLFLLPTCTCHSAAAASTAAAAELLLLLLPLLLLLLQPLPLLLLLLPRPLMPLLLLLLSLLLLSLLVLLVLLLLSSVCLFFLRLLFFWNLDHADVCVSTAWALIESASSPLTSILACAKQEFLGFPAVGFAGFIAIFVYLLLQSVRRVHGSFGECPASVFLVFRLSEASMFDSHLCRCFPSFSVNSSSARK
jgi:hypothetical protein